MRMLSDGIKDQDHVENKNVVKNELSPGVQNIPKVKICPHPMEPQCLELGAGVVDHAQDE